MRPHRFVGREAEMAQLQDLLKKGSASLIVVRGRRRIGKSRLLEEFGSGMKSLFFSGLAPTDKITAQTQREEFVRQLAEAGIPGIQPDDWGNIFWHLSKHTATGQVLIVFDEISWMGGKDPTFLSKLKTAWDMHFKKNPQLILAMCGSISSWIKENILSSTGFVGRISLDLVIEELPLEACNAFWHHKGPRITAYEKFKVLAVTGGVPFYLEQIHPDLTAEQNVYKLCFSRGGLLVHEFDDIFSDLFAKRSAAYKKIISCLADGPKELADICRALGKSRGGVQSKHLDDLEKAGFLRRDAMWRLEDGETGKLSRYRLSDNYVRFYLKQIAPHRLRIERGAFPQQLPQWDGVMGLQFENLVVHNFRTVWRLLGIVPEEVVMDGPFFQNTTTRQPGCQVDYLIQTRFHNLYVCEVKFSYKPIGAGIIAEMEEKRKRLRIPRYCSIRPVLIHVNGVEDSVLEAGYFDKVLDFGALLA